MVFFKRSDFEEVGWMSALVPDTPLALDVMLYRVRAGTEPCGHSTLLPGTDQCEDCGAHIDGSGGG